MMISGPVMIEPAMIEELVTRSFERTDLEKNDLAKIGLATTEVATNEAVRIAADEAGEVVADRLPRAETIRTVLEMMSRCHRNSRRGTKRTTSMIGIKKNDPLAPSGKTERMRATSVRAAVEAHEANDVGVMVRIVTVDGRADVIELPRDEPPTSMTMMMAARS